MTIGTKIAKNGSKRYYVRDENGKLSQISREKAYELQIEADNKIMANLFEQTAEKEMTDIEQANYIAHVDIETVKSPTVYVKHAISPDAAAKFIRLCGEAFGDRLVNAYIRGTKSNTVNAEEQSTNTESANENSENNAELVNQLKTFSAKVRGLSCEEFLAENAGLSIAEYREQKAADENEIANREIEFKIEDIKSEIGRLESENYYTARNLYGIVVLEKHYATDESLQAYAAELVDEFNERLGKINEAQAELATLAPATADAESGNEPTAAEVNVAPSEVPNATEVARFQKGKTYRYYDANTGEPLWYITIDKRTNTTVTVSGEKFKIFIQNHDRFLNYDKPTESFIRGNYRIDAADACEESADEITPATLQKFIEAKKEVSYWRNSNGARIWQIAYIRYGVNGGFVGQTPWLNHTLKEADMYLREEYGMTILEYLAAEDKWNDTDKGAILKDKIERDCKPSVDDLPPLYPADADDDDDELIDPPAENRNATDNNRRKHYTINPPMPDEDTPIKINHVDIFITGNTLDINGFFECKKIETAYSRFRKIMAQAVHDNPQLEGWDNWEPAKKLTRIDDGWINENGDIALFAKGGLDTLAVDVNEDLFYIFGKFPNAFEAPAHNDSNAETDGSEKDSDNELIDEPVTTPADDFTAKLAELKAKQDAAKEKELAAKKVYDEAGDKYVECQEATQNFLDAHADKLTEKLKAIEIKSYITLVRDNGKEHYDVFSTNELYVYAFNGFGKMFLVRCRGNELGTYDTPAQIETVIERLKAAIERGDREFTFPTIEELTKPEVDTATKENNANELPTGKITVKSGTEAWAIVGKHFPKDNLEFCRAGKGFNNEDTFCYTLDEIIYVHATCTPDNKRVECIEIVNTYEESESERNILTVYINHDAATESAMEDAKTTEVDKDATADSLTCDDENCTGTLSRLLPREEFDWRGIRIELVQHLPEGYDRTLEGGSGMKHAAVMNPPTILHEHPIYSTERTTPTGTYHWAKSKNHKPPLLKKITRIKYVTLVKYQDGDQKQIGLEYTIWKRGWHHIKGARKRARA